MIPLGILGNRRGGAAAGAYELISTAYGTGSSGTITFSSLPADYKHLQIRYTARSVSTKSLLFRANSITSGYSTHYLSGNGTAVSSGAYNSGTSVQLTTSVGGSTTGDFAAGVIDVLDYGSTTKNKTVRVLNGLTGAANFVYLHSGTIPTTSALTTITLSIATDSFNAASRFSLYGIKG